MNWFESDRIDNLNDQQYSILAELLQVCNHTPKECILTDKSQMGDFMWDAPGEDPSFDSYSEAFAYRFDKLGDTMLLMFDVPLFDKHGNQKYIVDYIDEILDERQN